MRKRILSIVLVLALCLAYMPVQPVYAAEVDQINLTGIDHTDGGFGVDDFYVSHHMLLNLVPEDGDAALYTVSEQILSDTDDVLFDTSSDGGSWTPNTTGDYKYRITVTLKDGNTFQAPEVTAWLGGNEISTFDTSTNPESVSKTWNFSVVKADAVGVTVTTANKDYDGTPLTAVLTITDGDLLYDADNGIEDHFEEISQTDAGSQTINTVRILDQEGHDVTSSYNEVNVTVGTITVNPKEVTVTADDITKPNGQPDPELTVEIVGVLNDDTINYNITRVAGETNGIYDITVSGPENQGNYAVTFHNGTLTIADAITRPTGSGIDIDVYDIISEAHEDDVLENPRVENTGAWISARSSATYSLTADKWSPGQYDVIVPVHTEGEYIFGDTAEDYRADIQITLGGAPYTGDFALTRTNDTTITVTIPNYVTVSEHNLEYEQIDETNHRKTCSALDCTLHVTPVEEAHTYGEWEILVPATSTTEGERRRLCALCGYEEMDIIPPTGGGGGGGSTTPEESYDHTQPTEGVGAGIMDEEAWTWSERGNMPVDIATFNMILSNNSVSEDEDNPLPYPGLGTEHFLASDEVWTLAIEDPAIEPAQVVEVRVCQDNEPIYLANGDGQVDQSTFGNSDFFTVGVGTGDTKIDYPNLKTGDVVSNTSFNGVFVTKVQKSNNPTFDADLAKLKSDTIASFRAFELDHPEVFWLNGSIKLRVLTVTIGGEQTSFIFMTLVDDKGFTMRIAEYAAAGSIEAGIKQRDAAVAAIIAQIPAGATTREKIVNLNKWFTLNNEYNRSADLSAIGYTPHRSLKSLMGNFGINGPVCDGYSRGFKTVCDRLGIPVVLETGTASIGSHSELHMWVSVKVDGTWYGMDCTWNDPIVKGKDGKVSGYENEKYLLVGNDTVVDGAKFGVSHPANKTPGGVTGVLFANLILNPNEIYGYTAIDYDDVKSTDWFFDYVQDVSARGLMNGTSTNLFSPQGTATRGQIVQILYNIAGQPEVDEVKVDGWFGVPATWAMDKGIVAGYPDGDFHGNDPVTREQLATIIWAFEGAPEQSGELSFADADKVSSYAVNAMLWAKKEGIIGGKPGNLADPQGTATRAEIATIFSNYMK